MLNTSLSPWPSFTQEDADAVKDVILSNKVNYWTGNQCREFEKEFADWCGTEFAVALANGTLALDNCLKALEIGENDEVIVTPRTFLASASSIVSVGANPVFADVDLNSQNITAETIEPKLTSKTKAIIVVHLAGMPADMDPIMSLAKKYGLFVIEDCAQAHGAKYKGKSVGSIGDIGAWSFCQDKIMTTGGEGGMVTTNNSRLWAKMWSYKDHGKNYDAVYNIDHKKGFRWLHNNFGTNWRMMEVQAVLGRRQLLKLPMWTEKRQNNASMLNKVASKHRVIRTTDVSNEYIHACYKHYFFVNEEYLDEGWSRDKIIDEINSRGVPCYEGTCSEVYMEKAFDGTSFRPKERLLNAKLLGRTSIMMLVHPTLTKSEMKKSCEVLDEVLLLASAT